MTDTPSAFRFAGPFLLGLALLAVPRTAAAWGAKEHSAIARSAHALACRTLEGRPGVDAQKLRDVCPAGGMTPVMGDACDSPPGVKPQVVRRYAAVKDDVAYFISEGAALAGDFLKAAEEFDSLEAQRELSTIYRYLILANDNDDHFHPRVVLLMLRELTAARTIAREAHTQPVEVRRLELLHAALTHLAFALHFAQDAFAAGHIGFNRAGSSAGPSQRIHAVFNRMGRTLVSRDGHRFVVFGDGNYCQMSNDARFMVTSASAAILVDVLGGYVMSATDADTMIKSDQVDPLRYVPVAATMAQGLTYLGIFGPQVSYNHPPELHSLATTGASARQSVSIGAGSIYRQGWRTQPGRAYFGLSGMYIRGGNSEHPVDWGFAGGAFGSYDFDGGAPLYRAEAGLGARAGFVAKGLLTFEPCLLFAYEGGSASNTNHALYLTPRLQALVELGQIAFLRASAGYDIGLGNRHGFSIAANIGLLISAFGGGPLDLGNVSRGF